jgi:hypothetical protein
MPARRGSIGLATLGLVGLLASVTNAVPPCGRKACSGEVKAAGLTGKARVACFKEAKASCAAGECSCIGEPPCICDPLPPGCDCHPRATATTTPVISSPTTTAPPRCGNGVVDPGESCDPAASPPSTCPEQVPCNADCTCASPCTLQPGPPGPICSGGCLDRTELCLFDPTTAMCRCVPPAVACEQRPNAQCAGGLCPSPVGGCQDTGSACACPIP